MSITAGQLYAGARSRIGLNFEDGRLDDPNITGADSAIIMGLTDLCAAHDWDWLYTEGTISVIAGTESYALPENHMRTLWVSNSNDQEIFFKQRRDAIKYHNLAGSYPRFYSILNDKLYLSPLPSQNETFRHGYYKYLPLVQASTIAELNDVDLEIPDLYINLATLYVAKNITMMFKDYDAYRLVTSEIKAELDRVADNTRRSIGPVSPQTRPDW